MSTVKAHPATFVSFAHMPEAASQALERGAMVCGEPVAVAIDPFVSLGALVFYRDGIQVAYEQI